MFSRPHRTFCIEPKGLGKKRVLETSWRGRHPSRRRPPPASTSSLWARRRRAAPIHSPAPKPTALDSSHVRDRLPPTAGRPGGRVRPVGGAILACFAHGRVSPLCVATRACRGVFLMSGGVLAEVCALAAKSAGFFLLVYYVCSLVSFARLAAGKSKAERLVFMTRGYYYIF